LAQGYGRGLKRRGWPAAAWVLAVACSLEVLVWAGAKPTFRNLGVALREAGTDAIFA